VHGRQVAVSGQGLCCLFRTLDNTQHSVQTQWLQEFITTMSSYTMKQATCALIIKIIHLLERYYLFLQLQETDNIFTQI